MSKYFHEPWRDELHALSIVNAASNIKELYQLRAYEGHPLLYFISIFLGQCIHKSLLSFIILHALAAISCMYLIVYKLSVPWYIMVLCIFNYYFLWEFGTFNRSYIFIVLALLFSIHLFLQKKTRTALIILLLGTQLHMQALPLFICLFAYFIWHKFKFNLTNLKHYLFWGLTMFIAIFLCYYSSSIHAADAPPPPNLFIHFAQDYKEVLMKVNIGNLSLFSFKMYHFWNIFLFWNWPLHLLLFIFFTIASILLLPNKFKLFYFVAILAGIYFLFVIKGWGYRHYSFIWFSFFIFYCLSNATSQSKWLNYFICLFLIPQSISGITAVTKDIQHPFTDNKPTATFLQTLSTNDPIAVCQAYTADGLAYYIQKPMYYLGNNTSGTFIKWTNKHYVSADSTSTFQNDLAEYVNKFQNPYLVLSADGSFGYFENQILNSQLYNAQKIYSTQNTSIVGDENFNVYRMVKKY